MACKKWSLQAKLITSSIIGLALSILGAFLIPVIDYLVKMEVKKQVVLKEGNILYDKWKDLPIPIYMQFYMFDVKNPLEVLNGGKPYLEQKGPYTYREKRIKFDIVHHDNGTVSYRQNRTFHFIPEMSVGSESDEFTTVNPLYWALVSALEWELPEVNKIITYLTTYFKEEVFMKKNFSDIIWGWDDPLLAVAKTLAPKWFYTNHVGYFINKNNTNDGVLTIHTGEKDINLLGIIDKYNGTSYLNFWTTKWANKINGSDGTLGPPYVGKDYIPYAFQSDICRSISGIYTEDVEFKDVTLWRYGAAMAYLENATINPDNIGFCTPQTHCLDTGVINISSCQTLDSFHIPVAISLPHFYLASKKYLDAVINLHPNKEEHQTVLDVEPHTSWVFSAAKRLQINLHIKPIPNIDSTSKLTPVFVPVFWINESAAIDDKNLAIFRSMLLTPLQVIEGMEITLIVGGALILLLTIGYGFCKHQKGQKMCGSGDSLSMNDGKELLDNQE